MYTQIFFTGIQVTLSSNTYSPLLGRMESPPNVVVAIFQEESKVLLQYRINTIRSPEHWGLPAGTVEPGETGAAAIHREMAEELGVSFTPQRSPEYSCTVEGGKQFDGYIVDTYQGIINNREPEYCKELAWFELKQLPSPLTSATVELLRLHSLTLT